MAVSLNSNEVRNLLTYLPSGGFLLSAAEQFLKHELTKNFKARSRLLYPIEFGTITTSTGYSRSRIDATASRARLEFCFLAKV
jgi:hypothetical protein